MTTDVYPRDDCICPGPCFHFGCPDNLAFDSIRQGGPTRTSADVSVRQLAGFHNHLIIRQRSARKRRESTSSLRRHFDTLQSTGNGSSLVELQRGRHPAAACASAGGAGSRAAASRGAGGPALGHADAPKVPPSLHARGCLRRRGASAARACRQRHPRLALALAVLLIRQVAWQENTLLSQLLGQLSGERSAVERVALCALLTLLAEELTSPAGQDLRAAGAAAAAARCAARRRATAPPAARALVR